MWFKNFKYFASFLFAAAFTQALDGNYDRIKERVQSFAHQWAPQIWLHSQERFFPSNVTSFLNEVTVIEKIICSNCGITGNEPSSGTKIREQFLVTRKNRDCLLQEEASFLFGTNTSNSVVSSYAFVTTCDTAFNHFFISYWFFYPFNEGKQICTLRLGKAGTAVLPSFKVFQKCLGKAERYGNHVGDWEHVTLDVKNWTPNSLFLSVHSVGVHYKYDQTSRSFVVSSAPARGVTQVQLPPPVISLLHGHPQLFSAKGSHGLWGSPGSYFYTKLRLSQLVDEADYGTVWETWRDLQLFFTMEWTPDWYKYGGKWGNPRSDCFRNTNICFFNDGPDGLANRRLDFYC